MGLAKVVSKLVDRFSIADREEIIDLAVSECD
jgi:hypothetical protein